MVDFDAVYQGRTPLGGKPPWDIQEPQPVIVTLEQEGRIRGDVLDAGCGTGENTLYLALRSHRVTGIDVSSVSVDKARGKAASRGLRATFVVADALALSDYKDDFDTVVDCGLFDVCPRERQASYAEALHRATRPGAFVYLLELSASSARFVMELFVELGVPEHQLTSLPQLVPDDLRTAFADGWREDFLEESTMRVRLPRSMESTETPALFAGFQRVRLPQDGS
jgi:SAM-dependent methyltransferase